MKRVVILALDIGTSSTRAAIYDAKGNRIGGTTAQFNYPLITAQDGRAELRPADIDRAVMRAMEKTLRAWREMKSTSPIAGVGISCFWHSLLGLDGKGSIVTSIYTWADSRCRKEAELLRRKNGEKSIHAQTGCMARASFWPAKLIWLRKSEPALFRRVARWVSPAEWIQEKWCGVSSTSISMASGTGLLDARTLGWHGGLLRRCGISETKLNPISDEPVRVSTAMSRRFPELAQVPWYPGLGDGAASNLGSGAATPGIAAINVGTSAALRIVTAEEARAPFGLFSYRVDAHRRLLGGAVSNAGNLHAWALRELKLPGDPVAIEKLLQSRVLPVPRLTLLPFWIAERAPTWPEEIPSAVIGITEATSALDLLQAFQEATYHRLAQISVELEKAVHRKLAFIVSGGIQHSPSALQRLADVLGRPVYASSEPEASLRGAACFVLEKLGRRLIPPKRSRAIQPRFVFARAYARVRREQMKLETLLRNAKLASIYEDG